MARKYQTHLLAALATVSLWQLPGCSVCERCGYMGDIRPTPLGTISDDVWRKQESNAEASDFVVYEHEWVGNSTELNHAGMDHVKQIAARAANVPFPIIIEQSSMSVKPGTKYGFPIHNDEHLDLARREYVVEALTTLGVLDASERVVIAPALTPGFRGFEAERAFNTGFNSRGSGGGFGGGFGGGGGGFF
ncbi:MAG: hypothetical protein KDA80_24115 [Planctomycetaceae bacterium]|nr:hypothetical protein [Planctomycetaceae bacterium]